jgi:hypothetical protein
MTDDDRDYAEENYWRNYCDYCDSSPCRSDDNHAAEIAEDEWLEASSHPSYWSNTEFGVIPPGYHIATPDELDKIAERNGE